MQSGGIREKWRRSNGDWSRSGRNLHQKKKEDCECYDEQYSFVITQGEIPKRWLGKFSGKNAFIHPCRNESAYYEFREKSREHPTSQDFSPRQTPSLRSLTTHRCLTFINSDREDLWRLIDQWIDSEHDTYWQSESSDVLSYIIPFVFIGYATLRKWDDLTKRDIFVDGYDILRISTSFGNYNDSIAIKKYSRDCWWLKVYRIIWFDYNFTCTCTYFLNKTRTFPLIVTNLNPSIYQCTIKQN